MAKRFGEQWGIDEVLSAFSMLHSNGISSAHRIVAMLAMQVRTLHAFMCVYVCCACVCVVCVCV